LRRANNHETLAVKLLAIMAFACSLATTACAETFASGLTLAGDG